MLRRAPFLPGSRLAHSAIMPLAPLLAAMAMLMINMTGNRGLIQKRQMSRHSGVLLTNFVTIYI